MIFFRSISRSLVMAAGRWDCNRVARSLTRFRTTLHSPRFFSFPFLLSLHTDGAPSAQLCFPTIPWDSFFNKGKDNNWEQVRKEKENKKDTKGGGGEKESILCLPIYFLILFHDALDWTLGTSVRCLCNPVFCTLCLLKAVCFSCRTFFSPGCGIRQLHLAVIASPKWRHRLTISICYAALFISLIQCRRELKAKQTCHTQNIIFLK